MKQGWKFLCAGLAIATIAAVLPVAADAAKSAASPAAAGASTTKKSMRQYTGWVTALDKTSITVEKRGKKPESKVFSKHAEMSTTGGDVEKDARVTVYYRDEAGRPVAHKVVVKPTPIAGR